jgi:transcriptional regulator with PAS, ATPase and Fis domain
MQRPDGAANSIVGVSGAIREVVSLVDTVAGADCAVLIEGESGTGKELVARRLHRLSRRREAPFIPVNCAGISATLFESQFFGHVRGSFTGASQEMLGLIRAAEGGTLFMDEIGEIPLGIQPKLLRVFQDGELLPVGSTSPVRADTRFIAATNRDLREEVEQGNFRGDLFYRLNVVRVYLPPLRERIEDIWPLLDHFLDEYASRYDRERIHLGEGVRQRLKGFHWPGNVRELATFVERLYATKQSPQLLADSLFAPRGRRSRLSVMPESILSLQEAEQWAIRQAMEASERNIPRAAALLKIHRSTLWRKLQQHDLA